MAEAFNEVNIKNLPQAEEINDTDLLIVEAQTGTKVIEYSKVKVVKTDDAGNVTSVGAITATDIIGNSLQFDSISGVGFSSQGFPGITVGSGEFTTFTINGGLVTSAVNTRSTDIVSLSTTTFSLVTSTSAALSQEMITAVQTASTNSYAYTDSVRTYYLSSLPNYAEIRGVATIVAPASSATITTNSSDLLANISTITPADITVGLQDYNNLFICIPYISAGSISKPTTTTAKFTVVVWTNNQAVASNIDIDYKIFFTY